MTVQRIKIQAGNLADLQAVVKYYEENAKPGDPARTNITTMYRPIENMQASLSSSAKTLNAVARLKEDWSAGKEAFEKVNNAYKENTSEKINEWVKGIYTPGQSVSREKTVTVGPVQLKMTGTVAALADENASPEQKAFAILNDCLPCDWRLKPHNLLPDFSFLDGLINSIAEFITTIQMMVESIVSPAESESDLCVILNMLDFTCVPDMQALLMMLAKSINISASIPGLNIPSLDVIGAALLVPFFLTANNLVMEWVNFVVKPVRCITDALKNLVKKLLRYDFSKVPEKVSANFSATGGRISYGKKVLYKGVNAKKSYGVKDIKGGKEFFRSLDTTNFANRTAKALEFVIEFLEKQIKKFMSFAEKIMSKAKSAMNQLNSQITALQTSISEIMRLLNMITLVSSLTQLFNGAKSHCGNPTEALDAVKNAGARVAADAMPGKKRTSTLPGNDAGLVRQIRITPDEAKVLGLSELDGVVLEPIQSAEDKDPDDNTILYSVRSTISLASCITPIAVKQDFASVHSLIKSF